MKCFYGAVFLSVADGSLSRMGVSQGSLWKTGRKPLLGRERTQLPLITGLCSPSNPLLSAGEAAPRRALGNNSREEGSQDRYWDI